VQRLNRKVRQLESTIERMVVDANRMHRCYEQIICESAQQFESFKEEYHSLRCSANEEKKEGEVVFC
jgi:hypothetical protein